MKIKLLFVALILVGVSAVTVRSLNTDPDLFSTVTLSNAEALACEECGDVDHLDWFWHQHDCKYSNRVHSICDMGRASSYDNPCKTLGQDTFPGC